MYRKVRGVVSPVAAILLGLTFIASGSGKLFGNFETSAQVMAFINDILPEALLIPPVIYFIYNILVLYLFPIAELALGACLLAGFVPALAALLSLPLLFVFLATNIWAILVGGYETCASCFGLWEEIFGHLTPVQSLTIDILLIALALLVILMHPGKFLSSRWPVTLLFKRVADTAGSTTCAQTAAHTMAGVKAQLIALLRAAASLRRHPWAYAGYLLGMLGIMLFLLASFNALPTFRTEPAPAEAAFIITDNVTVTDITALQGTVNFTTSAPEIIDLLVYDRYGKISGTWSENFSDTRHSVVLDNLTPATTYYLQILFSDRKGGKNITSKYQFTTTETPPAISDVIMTGMTETSVSFIWETDRPTTTEVTAWQMDTMEELRIADAELDTSHFIRLESLTADRDYSFIIRAIDVYGHQLSTVYSGAFTLKTGGRVSQRAPDFNLPSITGERISLSQYHGKTVLLVFWNMTCPICRTKMPLLQEINDKQSSDKLALVTVHGSGREAAIKSFLESERVNFTVLLDSDGATGYSYNVSGVPSTFIIDGAGIVRMIEPKFNNLQEFESMISQISPSAFH